MMRKTILLNVAFLLPLLANSICLAQSAPPCADGQMVVYNSTSANWICATVGTNGFLGNTPRKRYYHGQVSVPASTSLNNVGAWTITGASATPTNADDTDGGFIGYAGIALDGTEQGIASSSTITRADWKPEMSMRFKTHSTLTATRWWVGLFSGSPVGSATPTVHYAGWRYDTVADGTAFWRCVSDNASGTPQVTTTTIAASTSTLYEFGISLTATTSQFWANISGTWTLVATHSTTIPTSTTLLSLYGKVTTLENVAKTFNFGVVKLHTN